MQGQERRGEGNAFVERDGWECGDVGEKGVEEAKRASQRQEREAERKAGLFA